VYSSHCFEHLTKSQVKELLSECYRVLKKNGILRIIVPNMKELFDNYDKKNISYFSWFMDKQDKDGQIWVFDSWIRLVVRCFAGHVVDLFSDKELNEMYLNNNREEFVNKILSKEDMAPERWVPNTHKSFWTPENLKKEFELTGFQNICLSKPSKSKEKVFRNRWFFDNTLPEKSIIMEATK
jgi:ubiquinone/menaquinone biosynthesis C-methylase UbiE